MQLLQNNELRTTFCEVGDTLTQSQDIVLCVSSIVLLQKSYSYFSHISGYCIVQQ